MRPSICAIATGVMAGALGFAIVAPTGTAGTIGKRDPADAEGPLDVARVQLEQSGPKLELRIQTRGSWAARELDGDPRLDPHSPERYLCVELAQREARLRSCLTATGSGRKVLTRLKLGPSGEARAKGVLPAQVTRGGDRSFRAEFRFADAGLRAGSFGWRAISGWDDPVCAGEPNAPPPPSCVDRVPDGGGFANAKIRRPRIVGCTHSGPLVRDHGSRGPKQVALTFDDGPSAYTSKVIQILDRRQAKGTFFVIGQEIAGRHEVMRDALAHGNEIGNHTMHHGLLAPASDLRVTSSRIRQATGFRPCSFRPPGGVLNLSLARSARSAGMTTVVWDVDTRDWTGVSSSVIRSRATAVERGSIVLMHDGGGNRGATVAALPGIISNLKRRGFELVTVSRVLGERMIRRP